MRVFFTKPIVMGLCTVLANTALVAHTIVVPDSIKTIQRGIDAAQEGDTVFVRNGSYRENLILPTGIVLKGQSSDSAIIRGDRANPVIRAANNTVVMNLTICNGGIGVMSENTNALIQNNIIKENTKSGIQCLISLPQIRNNLIASNEWTGIFCELISFGMRTAIEHNVIADNGNSGVTLSNKSVVLVQNNVFYRNKEFGIFVTENSKRSRIIYNALYDNRKPFNNYAVIDETNIGKDPQFPALAKTTYAALTAYDSPYRGLGKDGSTIGLVAAESFAQSRLDSDKDGITDDKDKCPNEPEDMDGFEDTDGCPDYDNDLDGIYDSQDKCPNEAEDFDGFEDSDGCPDTDNDKDGIPDSLDKCPNNPETVNGYKDDDGCPDEKPN
jgi:OmpA-OmpF porin, OOP family